MNTNIGRGHNRRTCSEQEGKNAANGVSRSVLNIWILLFVRKIFISVQGKWLCTYGAEAHHPGNDCFEGHVMPDVHVDLLGDRTVKCIPRRAELMLFSST